MPAPADLDIPVRPPLAASADEPLGGRLRAPWRPLDGLALIAGWAVALAAMMPAASQPGAEAGRLSLGAALLFWPLALWIARFDLAHFLIPDEATAAVAALGLAGAAAGPWLGGEGVGAAARSALGAAGSGAGAFALFWAVGAAFRACGRDGLGHGDVKLAGACALWLPPGDAALALEIASLGAVAMLLVGKRGAPLRDTAVPFGAFLAPAAWIAFVLATPFRDAGLLPW